MLSQGGNPDFGRIRKPNRLPFLRIEVVHRPDASHTFMCNKMLHAVSPHDLLPRSVIPVSGSHATEGVIVKPTERTSQ